jgi:hypothetical protein
LRTVAEKGEMEHAGETFGKETVKKKWTADDSSAEEREEFTLMIMQK